MPGLVLRTGDAKSKKVLPLFSRHCVPEKRNCEYKQLSWRAWMFTRGTKHFKERDNFCVGKTSVSGFPCFYHQLNVSLPQSSSLRFLIVNVCWWPPNAGMQPAFTWPWISIPSLISPKLHLPSSHFQLLSRHGCLDIKPSTSMCSKLDSLLYIFLSVKWIILSFK